MPTKPTNATATDRDEAVAGLVACYNRLPQHVRRKFWQARTTAEALLILAGQGGSEPAPAAEPEHLRPTAAETIGELFAAQRRRQSYEQSTGREPAHA